MGAEMEQAVSKLLEELRNLEVKTREIKQAVNLLRKIDGNPPMFTDSEMDAAGVGEVSVAPDEFVNKSLNGAIRRLLDVRRNADPRRGPATIEEIYEGLRAGGYGSFTGDRERDLQGLRISLGKSTHTFMRLPNGSYARNDWYGIKKPRKPSGSPIAAGLAPAADEEPETEDVQETLQRLADENSTTAKGAP